MNNLGMCALLGVMAGGLPAMANPENRVMALTLLVPGSDSIDLEAFLSERVHETWLVDDGAPTHFEVTINWLEEHRLVVRVAEAGRELTRREIEVADPGATKLTVWLVVKSTINRALLEGVPETTVELTTTPPVTEIETESRQPTWGVGALLTTTMSQMKLLSFGPTLVAWLNPWQRLVVTLEAGYRISPAVNVAGQGADLTVHYVPMTVSSGWQLNEARTWTAGGFVTADLKLPIAETGSGTAVGLDLGGYVQTRLPLTDHSHFFARLFAGARAARMRFLLDEGSITEGPVLGGLALGALWQ